MTKVLAAWIALWCAAGCASTPVLDETRLVDLTHAFDAATIYWPTAERFAYERTAWGPGADGKWYAAGQFHAAEHGGTHTDAPLHFAESMRAVQELPLRQLVAPIRVIDVTRACNGERDYAAQPRDLAEHEQRHGRIPPGAAVIVRTGWERYWSNAERYLGGGADGSAEDLHFPGISPELAAELVARRVDLVGIDTPSLDHGPSREFATHRVLARANVPGLENLTGLAELPEYGATLIALPMKIAGGTGAPTRVIALVP